MLDHHSERTSGSRDPRLGDRFDRFEIRPQRVPRGPDAAQHPFRRVGFASGRERDREVELVPPQPAAENSESGRRRLAANLVRAGPDPPRSHLGGARHHADPAGDPRRRVVLPDAGHDTIGRRMRPGQRQGRRVRLREQESHERCRPRTRPDVGSLTHRFVECHQVATLTGDHQLGDHRQEGLRLRCSAPSQRIVGRGDGPNAVTCASQDEGPHRPALVRAVDTVQPASASRLRLCVSRFRALAWASCVTPSVGRPSASSPTRYVSASADRPAMVSASAQARLPAATAEQCASREPQRHIGIAPPQRGLGGSEQFGGVRFDVQSTSSSARCTMAAADGSGWSHSTAATVPRSRLSRIRPNRIRRASPRADTQGAQRVPARRLRR